MGMISWISERLGTKTAAPVPAQNVRSTGYFAAEYSRVTASLVSEARHINSILRWQGKTLLARSRQLADNNPHVVKFLSMVVNNVAGPVPFQLQGRIVTRSGKPDTVANLAVETAWTAWSRPRTCDRTGRLSLNDYYRLALRIIARDGECFIRIHEGTDAGPFGFQLQIIDTDRIDHDHNQQLAGGNVIHAGIELDRAGRAVAYHVRKTRPADWQFGAVQRAEYDRVPAEQMLHLFVPLSAEQVRGVPWIYAAILNLHNLGAFEEAAIIAARVGAAKMGFFKRTDPVGGEYGGEKDSTGAKITDAEPGTFEELPFGLEMQEWNPNYPDAQVGPFIKACMRGIASGLLVSYSSIGNDLEAVNFSSARIGLLEERDQWMVLQNWFTEHGCVEIYERWLAMAALSGRLAVNGSLEKYNAVYFQPRRWQWVDPLKDVTANIEAIKWGLKSRTEVVAEQGKDIADTFDQLAAEQALAADKQVAITEQTGGQKNVPQDDNDGQ